MDCIQFRQGVGFCEERPLEILAKEFGTPLYIYSKSALHGIGRSLKQCFETYPTLVCYSVKANGNLSILRDYFSLGFGADIVSGGELDRALVAGCNPSKIVFSGVGKQSWEIERALNAGILSFNVESIDELTLLEKIARHYRKTAPIALRINPNIDIDSHPHIATGLYRTKFGFPESQLPDLCRIIKQSKGLSLIGISCHIGSQILELSPLVEAATEMARISQQLIGIGFRLEFIDLGGGLGICYRDETPPSFSDYAHAMIQAVKNTNLRIIIEPGRMLIGNVGALLTTVVGIKRSPERNFIIVDAAMNDLIRPSLYDAYHTILPADQRKQSEIVKSDIVGPICESGDFLGLDRSLPQPSVGDILVIKSVGAYGMSMASHYNTRPRPPEIMVEGSSCQVIRRREMVAELFQHEK